MCVAPQVTRNPTRAAIFACRASAVVVVAHETVTKLSIRTRRVTELVELFLYSRENKTPTVQVCIHELELQKSGGGLSDGKRYIYTFEINVLKRINIWGIARILYKHLSKDCRIRFQRFCAIELCTKSYERCSIRVITNTNVVNKFRKSIRSNAVFYHRRLCETVGNRKTEST